MAKREEQGSRAVLKLTRSFIGRNGEIRATLRALGLRRVGDEKEHVLNPAVLGMIRKVKHVVTVNPLQ